MIYTTTTLKIEFGLASNANNSLFSKGKTQYVQLTYSRVKSDDPKVVLTPLMLLAGDYQLGANAAGFKKVADAMIEQGQVFSNKL